jgi:hypothetical protein
MSDKVEGKEEDLSNLNVVGYLTPAQYWEWRCTLEEMTSARHVFVVTQQKFELMAKDIEIARLKNEVYKTAVQAAKANVDRLEADYQVYRKKLEETLGFTLESCTIDAFNFAVRKL